jgi:DNA-directed RNA polymerase I subunit RPA1
VCEITSSVSVDALGSPLPNGVYDPRLGPPSAESPPCTTCALRYLGCPGHFGHMELCVPLYHPLLFGKLVEILRIKCLNCHKLTAAPGQLEVYKVKFELLRRGRYSEALDLDDRLAAVMKDSKQRKDETKGAVSIQSALLAVDEVLKELSESMSGTVELQKMSSFEETCYRDLAKEVVSNCRSAKNCPHCGAFSPRIRQDSSNKIFQSPLAATSKRINEAEGIEIVPALVSGNGGEAKSSYSDGEDETAATADNNVGDGEEHNLTESSRDRYMHPSEVKAQVERTWATNPELCKALFAVQGGGVFFLQAVAVPPNRFRPPMHLGGMIVEHAQNMYLNKILTSNELVRVNFVNKSEANAYKHWIDLQTHLNCYMDSSKDPSMNQNMSPGIRQLLERKEGIFRKHMMGKRVNFACRSVISPDPYIGTNEIGIPRHFAVTLTYPTPVTDINIEEMKTLVERGPDQYPGARWVEFPDRRVDLSKMDEHKREAAASMLLKYAKKGGQPAIVGRQMRDGDMVLMNRQVRFFGTSGGCAQQQCWSKCRPEDRQMQCLDSILSYASPYVFLCQPTLHKPGIMAHEVRVLHSPTQKTIRMHYAST